MIELLGSSRAKKLPSLILSSIRMKCKDQALNHAPTMSACGSWDSLEPNGTGLSSLLSLVA